MPSLLHSACFDKKHHLCAFMQMTNSKKRNKFTYREGNKKTESRTVSNGCPHKERRELSNSRILPMAYGKQDKVIREKMPDNIHYHRAQKASQKGIPHFCSRRTQET